MDLSADFGQTKEHVISIGEWRCTAIYCSRCQDTGFRLRCHSHAVNLWVLRVVSFLGVDHVVFLEAGCTFDTLEMTAKKLLIRLAGQLERVPGESACQSYR